MKIGYRTVKTAIGTGVAISIAQMIGLSFYVSAGILVILNIKPTKKRSISSAWQRFVACIVGMVFAIIFFEGLAFHPVSIILLLLLFIPTVVMLKAKEGVITSSVIILHLYTTSNITLDIIINELLLIVIGIGVALIFNLYMPSMESKIVEYREKIEEKFTFILQQFAVYLQDGESDWDGKEIIEVGDLLKEAKTLALKDIENHVLRENDSFYSYFKMREKQFEIIERLLPIISSLDQTYIQGKKIAQFLEELSLAVSPNNTARFFLEELEEMKQEFRNSPLPRDRKEFETRSALLHFLNEMEQYLLLKRYFKREDTNKGMKVNA
ncbi:aromatic acid exporter family protein [Pseudalkalibacillus caeni]|uniref:Aromatic acid exporter family protein n=1 Tax=Exobacillus caeni TaxID=2574798 RepID=A0A5R9F1S2_9BACL|nr:aromatic acid exporter family protein [Pseudalkalibacillus caeni]TLS36400.1 aromatic acid exporter family protein [Pseudalkalibacillus caeni]